MRPRRSPRCQSAVWRMRMAPTMMTGAAGQVEVSRIGDLEPLFTAEDAESAEGTILCALCVLRGENSAASYHLRKSGAPTTRKVVVSSSLVGKFSHSALRPSFNWPGKTVRL